MWVCRNAKSAKSTEIDSAICSRVRVLMLARLGIALYWVGGLGVRAIVGFGLLVPSTYGHRQGNLGAYIIFLGAITWIVWGWGGSVLLRANCRLDCGAPTDLCIPHRLTN